jgi:hypothetical protein
MKNFKDSIFFSVNHKFYVYHKGTETDGEELKLILTEDENVLIK